MKIMTRRKQSKPRALKHDGKDDEENNHSNRDNEDECVENGEEKENNLNNSIKNEPELEISDEVDRTVTNEQIGAQLDDEVDLENEHEHENETIYSDDDDDDNKSVNSFSSELYSSQTSSSFPASEGFETPNSCTNDSDMKEKFNDNDKTMDTDEKTDKIAAVSGTKMDKSNKATKNGKDGCYQCQFCDKSFPRLGYLKKHEQSHAEHMPFKCEYCARLFKHKRSRDRHTKLHTGDRRYRCPHCESAFSRSDHLKIHMKTHDNQKPFQCTVCNRGYNTAAALTSHMQNHKKQAALAGAGNASSMYNYSPRSTGSASSTNSHKRKYSTILDSKCQQQMSPQSAPATPAANINCFYCTKSDFISMEQLNLHIGTMHSNRLLSSPAEFHFRMQQQHQKFYENFQFPCEFCTMKFPTIEKVFHHIKVSHVDRIGSPSNYLEHFNRNLCSTYGISSGQENVGDDSKKAGDSEESSRKSDVADKEIKKEAEDNESVKEQETEEQPTDLSQPKSKKIKEEHGNDEKTCSSTPNSNERRSIEPTSLPPSAFLCNQCNASLPDFESFRLHLRSHLEQNHHAGNNGISLMNGVFPSQNGGNFVCHQCGTTLENRDDYEHHIEKHFVIINSEFVCQCCNKFFPKSEDLQKHLNEQHVQTIFKCSLCKETFDTKISIQLHFAVQHSNEIKLYRCSVCLDVFRLEKEFKHHVRTRHLQQNAIQCVFCRVVCTSELEMHFHLAAHVKQFRCPACSESFHVEFLLDRHLQTHHSQKEINAAELKASASQSNSHLIKNSNFYNYQITNKFYPPEPFGSPSLLLNNNIYDSLRGSGHLYNSPLDSKKSGRDLLTPKSNLLNLYNPSQIYHGTKGEGAEESPSTSSTVKSSLYMPPVGTPHHLSQRYHQQNSMIRNLYEKAFQKATATNDSNNNNSNNSSENDNNNNMHQLELQKQQQQKFRATEINGNDCGICERNDGAGDTDHRKTAHNSKAGVSLKCAYCSGDFRSRTELENHMKIQHNIGGKHKCLICDEILPSPAVLAEHKLQHCKVGASGKCSLCSHPLQDINSFKQHLNKHGQQISTNLSVTKNKCANYEIPIQCICCRQILSSEFEITLHAKFHTKSPDINEERTCALCLEIIPKSNTKKICDSCIKKHNFTPAAGGHAATSSTGKSTENGNGSGSAENIPIQCNLCKKIQMNAYKLQEHLIEHTFQDCGSSSNGYVCYICTSIFTSAGGLQQHIHQEHEKGDMDKNIKPYDCNVCDARYFFRTELEHHVLEHEKNVANKIPSSNFSAEDSQEDRNIKIERQSEKDDDSRNEVLKMDNNGPDNNDDEVEVD